MSKRIIVLATIIALVFPAFQVALAAPPAPPGGPDIPIDCGVWAYDPYKSGSSVKGKGEVSCASAHSQLKVNVELQDSAGRHFYAQKTCNNASYCAATASGSYVAGRDWMTGVSGYVGSWNAYYQTDWVHIP